MSDPRDAVYLKEILPTQAEAEREVARLNALNEDKNCEYYWHLTRYSPQGRHPEA